MASSSSSSSSSARSSSLIPNRNRGGRCILCVDLDYFFAQVLLQSRPDLVGKPVGIKQKYIIVTCTYEARALGIKKLMLIEDALKIKPDLDILDGSDLTPFRAAGKAFFQVARATLGTEVPLERKGFDEIYADITGPAKALVQEKRESLQGLEFRGHVFPPAEFLTADQVANASLLKAGSEIALELRREIMTRLKLKSCAGVSTSKFGAKLASNMNKPNDQTTFVTGNDAAQAYFHDLELRSIPGLGYTTRRLLRETGFATEIKTCGDLLNKTTTLALAKALNGDVQFAETLMQLARGEDYREVESMDVLTKQLSREETRLPHPATVKALRERVEELSELVYELMETRFLEAFEWPTTVKLIIKFRGEAGRRSKSRQVKAGVTDQSSLLSISNELLNEFALSSAFVASHVNLCVTDFQVSFDTDPQPQQIRSALGDERSQQTQRGSGKITGIQAYFGASSSTPPVSSKRQHVTE